MEERKHKTGSTYDVPRTGAWNRHQALLAVHYNHKAGGSNINDVVLWCKDNITHSIRPDKDQMLAALGQLYKGGFTRCEGYEAHVTPKPGSDYLLTDLGWQALAEPELLNPTPTKKHPL